MERYRIERMAPPPDDLAGSVCPSGDEWVLVRNHDDEPMSVYATLAEADAALREANASLMLRNGAQRNGGSIE